MRPLVQKYFQSQHDLIIHNISTGTAVRASWIFSVQFCSKVCLPYWPQKVFNLWIIFDAKTIVPNISNHFVPLNIAFLKYWKRRQLLRLTSDFSSSWSIIVKTMIILSWNFSAECGKVSMVEVDKTPLFTGIVWNEIN